MEIKSEGQYELLTFVIYTDGYRFSILPTQEK